MSLIPEITSKNHEEYVEGMLVSYKYFVNAQDVWWYCFDDIVEFVHMNENYADKLYSQLSDNEKETFGDWNNDLRDKRTKARRFVTSEVVRQFIERNNQRNNILIKSMNNLEFKEDSHEKYFEDDELANSIEKLHTALHNKDYEELTHQCFMVSQTESAREVLDKCGIIDKEKEEYVDKYREMLYDPDIEEVEIIGKLRKKEDAPTEEERKILYKKNKNKEHKIPYWLKDLVK